MAKRKAEAAGVADRITFEVIDSKHFPGEGYDLVCTFDCLHDMGDPVGASVHIKDSLKEIGSWLIVEPFAGDTPESNHNPVGRIFYSASTMILHPGVARSVSRLGIGSAGGRRKTSRCRHRRWFCLTQKGLGNAVQHHT